MYKRQGQEFPRPSRAGLHLVHDQQQIPFPAKLLHCPKIIEIQCDNAALALDAFQHHGADTLIYAKEQIL